MKVRQLRRLRRSNPRRLPLQEQTRRARRHWMALRLDSLAAPTLEPEHLYVPPR